MYRIRILNLASLSTTTDQLSSVLQQLMRRATSEVRPTELTAVTEASGGTPAWTGAVAGTPPFATRPGATSQQVVEVI